MTHYTTGQAAGLTRLTVKTIQRYIREFEAYFSEGARIPKKGRRYTPQDIRNLLTISQMIRARENHENIRATLDHPHNAPPMLEIDNALQLAQVSQNAVSESRENAERAHRTRTLLEGDLTYIKKSIRTMSEKIRELEGEIYRLRQTVNIIKKPQ